MADPAYIVNGVLTDGEAWVAVASTTLGSDTATVTFTSTDDGQVGDWSQYMDLVVVGYGRSSRASVNGGIGMQFNSDTASNYPIQWFWGDGASAAASTASYTYAAFGDWPAASVTDANTFGSSVAHLFDINSGKHKSVINRSCGDRSGGGYVELNASTWKSQAAITEIDFIDTSGADFKAGSRIDLFGVLPRMVA